VQASPCTYIPSLAHPQAAQLSQKNLNHKAGSLEYMAPEVLDKPRVEDVFHKVRTSLPLLLAVRKHGS